MIIPDFRLAQLEMERRVKEAKGEVTTIMENIRSKLGKNKDLNDVLMSSENKETLSKLYNCLCTYYKNNPSLWSNFCSMWKKIHRMMHAKLNGLTDASKRQKLIRCVIAAATTSKEYSKVNKGIIHLLRLPESKPDCYGILTNAKQLIAILKQGKIKVKNPNCLPGPLMPEETHETEKISKKNNKLLSSFKS